MLNAVGRRPPITEDEIIGTVQLLILGGLETTAGALGLMVARFCREPEIPALLRAQPELIPSAVHELLRLDPPFVSVGRTAVRDAELGGHPVSAGDKVLIHWASANRDDAEFAAPDRFDPDRERNRHLAFGAGPHRCAGSEPGPHEPARSPWKSCSAACDDIRLQPGADIRYHPGLTRSPLPSPSPSPPPPPPAPPPRSPLTGSMLHRSGSDRLNAPSIRLQLALPGRPGAGRELWCGCGS